MTRSAVATALAVLVMLLAPAGRLAAEVGDIVFTRAADGPQDTPPAIFPHFVHRIQFKCAACHDALFEMKAGANPITMDAIQSGKYCGSCHNGKVAFQATFDACPRCHRT